MPRRRQSMRRSRSTTGRGGSLLSNCSIASSFFLTLLVPNFLLPFSGVFLLLRSVGGSPIRTGLVKIALLTRPFPAFKRNTLEMVAKLRPSIYIGQTQESSLWGFSPRPLAGSQCDSTQEPSFHLSFKLSACPHLTLKTLACCAGTPERAHSHAVLPHPPTSITAGTASSCSTESSRCCAARASGAHVTIWCCALTPPLRLVSFRC